MLYYSCHIFAFHLFCEFWFTEMYSLHDNGKVEQLSGRDILLSTIYIHILWKSQLFG